ncbi:MAG: phospholipase [Deinococcales bacterium]|nr:phospholipase [Deinococcales bacterium]
MVHGRGDSAPGILSLASALEAPGVAYVAPQARHNTWYPYSFMAPMERNEPWLSSALAAVHGAVEEVVAAGVPRERIVLLGFSQGACLASEYLARHAQRFGGLAALSGGLIGPEGTPRDYEGSLGGTPVFLGCSDVDPHIPVERVHETEEVLARLGAQVDKRIYPGFGHSVNQDEVDAVNAMLRGLVDG